MENILSKIIKRRKEALSAEKELQPFDGLRKKAEGALSGGYVPLPFLSLHSEESPFLIAEIKKASPSKGLIREDFDPSAISRDYHSASHVKAVSVLTEPDFFKGGYDFLTAASKAQVDAAVKRPFLMKDFIVEPYQILRGFLSGASAVLLIASVLSDGEAESLRDFAREFSMEVLFEAHDREEFLRGKNLGFPCIGINNRDLATFETDCRRTGEIIAACGKPENALVISESGFHSREDIETARDGGADGFLIGEHFMRRENIPAAVEDLFRGLVWR